jgi:hypothetical protein
MTVVRDRDSADSVCKLDAKPNARRRPSPPAHWTVLAFLAGDNNLENALLDDFNEMERVGSRPGSVEILAQMDRPGGARRYYVTRDTNPQRIGSKLLADMGPTNTGDPRVLEDFIGFGARSFPSRATMLVLSNHGSGCYVPASMLHRHGAPSRRELLTRATPRLRRALFHTTRARLLQLEPASRGIAYDDGSADCLDNRELKEVLRHAHATLGRKVDVVGMDACLMTMLEVAYQIRDHAQILVGSEEVEPGNGWPHDAILRDLTARPAMGSVDLASTIVRRYVESYQGTGAEATQSAIDLSRLDDIVTTVDTLAARLLASLRSRDLQAAVHDAWRRTLRFFDNFYVDVHDFAGNLAAATTARDVRAACADVQHAIEGTTSPIIAQAHAGARLRAAAGLSIYFPPFRNPSAFYTDLEFARRTRWVEFLDAYVGTAK